MKPFTIFIFLLFCGIPLTVQSWGFFGHRTINHSAVFTLPPELFSFYKTHIEQITDEAVNPDKRRYIIETEAPRHYLDADFYEKVIPLDTIPKSYDSAVAQFGKETVLAHGIVPWHLIRVQWWLTKAFMEKDIASILRLSADLGHYVGDLHVPLHSTANYNGQLTNQRGIHGLWESRLPELHAHRYDFLVGKATYISDIPNMVWERFEESYSLKDSVLSLERILTTQVEEGKKFSFEVRGSQVVSTYSEHFSALYHNRLNNMVERRLQKSIHLLGSLWFTAWVDAGQPDLSMLVNFDYTKDTTLDSVEIRKTIKGRMETH